MITDDKNFWNNKAKSDKWQEYILPGRTSDEFEKEGLAQAIQFCNLINKDNVVLEYGCGVGRITKYLRFWSDNVIGIDICDGYIQKAKEKNKDLPGLRFYTTDEYKNKENVADFIISIMVMQHNSDNKFSETRQLYL